MIDKRHLETPKNTTGWLLGRTVRREGGQVLERSSRLRMAQNFHLRMRKLVVLVGLSVMTLLSLVVPAPAVASPPTPVTVETQKPFGPAPGTFSASGGISDAGSFANVSRVASAVPAPTFVINHLKQRFEGAFGTFTLEVQIKESVTEDPSVLTGKGTWAILDGTGAYATLRGRGTVTGTADHNTGVITRTYTGSVHYN